MEGGRIPLKRSRAARNQISRVTRDGASDLSRKKQVKFADPVNVHEPSLKHNASSFQIDRHLASNFKEAKTSEYKSFMKLREQSRLKLHTHFPSAANDSVEELNNSIQCKYNHSNPFMPIQKATSMAQELSPIPVQASQNCELNKTIACKYGVGRSQSPIQDTTPIAQGSLSQLKVSQNSGPECVHGGIFSKKRENIIQEAAKVLSVEIDDLILNRSDLISGLMKRLGPGMKSSKLEVLQKSVWKKSNGIGQLLASSKADDFCVGFHGDSGVHFSQTIAERQLGGDLLSCANNEANDLVTLPIDYVEAQTFPTWPAIETDLHFKKHKYQNLIDDIGILDLPPPGMITGRDFFDSTARKHLGKDLLTYRPSQDDDHSISSTSYVEPQSFPVWHALETDFRNKRKFKWTSDNWRISDLPDQDSSDLALVLHGTEGTGFYGTTCKQHARIDLHTYRFRDADDLVTSSLDYVDAELFPPLYSLETDLQCKKEKYKWLSKDRRVQDLPDEHKSASPIEWNTNVGSNSYGYHNMISVSSYFNSENFPSHDQFTGQLLTPLNPPTSMELCDFFNPGLNMQPEEEQRTLLLLARDDNINKELESCVPDGVTLEERDCLPLTLYAASDFHNQTKGCWFTDAEERRDTISSPRGDNVIALRDTFYYKQDGHLTTPHTSSKFSFYHKQDGHISTPYIDSEFSFYHKKDGHFSTPSTGSEFSLYHKQDGHFSPPSTDSEFACYHKQDGQFSTPRAGCELLRKKSLPVDSVCRFSKLKFHDMEIENIPNCPSAEHVNDVSLAKPNIVEFQNQLPNDISNVTGFPSFGVRSSQCEKGIFALMPDRLSWY